MKTLDDYDLKIIKPVHSLHIKEEDMKPANHRKWPAKRPITINGKLGYQHDGFLAREQNRMGNHTCPNCNLNEREKSNASCGYRTYCRECAIELRKIRHLNTGDRKNGIR